MNRWTNRKINISTQYTKAEREAIAFDIITYLQDRTKRGKGKDNKKWAPPADKYSKEYKESLDFKQKADKSKVNLTLSGDMLDSIDLLKSAKGEIRIGISEEDEDHGKAEGNIRGSYGKPTGSMAKSRDFLALSREELSKILRKYPIRDKEKRRAQVEIFKAATAAVAELDDKDGLPLGALISLVRGDEE